MNNYTINGRWVELNYIVKDVEIEGNEESYLIEAKLQEASTLILKKRLLRDRIYALNDARPDTLDTFDREDVYVLDTLDYGTIHVILRPEEIESFLNVVGPGYDDKK